MNYAIKTEQGYLHKYQWGGPSNTRELRYTPERASARWYQTESAARAAATRLHIPAPIEFQHVAA